MPETRDEISLVQRLAKEKLSNKRYVHVQNVANASVMLAKLYNASTNNALLAAWLHDLFKEDSADDLLQILQLDDAIAGSTATLAPVLWHGPCAAIFAKHQLGICCKEVLDAVSCHTLGKTNMSLLDKILYVADYTSEERSYPEAEIVRKHAQTSLDKAVLSEMECKLNWMKRKNISIENATFLAYESLKEHAIL